MRTLISGGFKIGNMQNPNYGNNLLKSSHCWFELLIDAATILSLSIFYEYYNDIERLRRSFRCWRPRPLSLGGRARSHPARPLSLGARALSHLAPAPALTRRARPLSSGARARSHPARPPALTWRARALTWRPRPLSPCAPALTWRALALTDYNYLGCPK